MSDCTFDESLDKWNTTSKATIIVYCYNYNNLSIVVFMCPSPKHYQCATWKMCHYLKLLKFDNFMVTRANALAIR